MAIEYVPYDGPIVSKEEAKASGLKYYFTGKNCNRGHLSQRRVDDRGCIACQRERAATKAYRDQRKDHYTQNAERIRERSRFYSNKRYAANPQKCHQATQKWRRENPDAARALDRNRRARDRGAEGFHTVEDLRRIRKQQKDRCAMPWCRTKLKGGGHEDHIIALKNGGSNWPSNIQFLCGPCNVRKNAKDPIDFAQEHGLLL